MSGQFKRHVNDHGYRFCYLLHIRSGDAVSVDTEVLASLFQTLHQVMHRHGITVWEIEDDLLTSGLLH